MSDNYVPEHRGETEEPIIGDAPPRARTLLSNKAYDALRFVAVIVLPALGTLYFGIAEIWGLPYAEEVVGTIMVLDTFAGVLLRSARKSYERSDARFDGAIIVSPGEDENTTDLNVRLDPEAVAGKDEIVVKVNRV